MENARVLIQMSERAAFFAFLLPVFVGPLLDIVVRYYRNSQQNPPPPPLNILPDIQKIGTRAVWVFVIYAFVQWGANSFALSGKIPMETVSSVSDISAGAWAICSMFAVFSSFIFGRTIWVVLPSFVTFVGSAAIWLFFNWYHLI